MTNNRTRRTIAVVGGDLMARSRIEAAAAANSLEVERLSPNDLESLETRPDVALVVLDLDSGGTELIDAWASLEGESRPRPVGFFSHVDVALGEYARSKGVDALPRGRFWRTLEKILASL